VTYICDGTWGQLEEYTPKWFEVEKIRIGV